VGRYLGRWVRVGCLGGWAGRQAGREAGRQGSRSLPFLAQVAATLINHALLFPILLLVGGIATRSAAKSGTSGGQGGGAKPADSEAGGDKAALLSSEKAVAQKGLPKPLGVALFLAWAVLLLALWAWADLPGAPEMARPSLQPTHRRPATATHPACNSHAPSLQPYACAGAPLVRLLPHRLACVGRRTGRTRRA
jgi:hypothetical protein